MCIALSACAANPTPSPDAAVQLPEGVPDNPNVLSVYDETGLLKAVRYVPNFEGIQSLTVAQGEGGLSTIKVGWVGLNCEARPTLTFAEHEGGYRVTLDHGPRPEDCALMAITYQVELELSEPVPISEIEAIEAAEL